MNDDEIQNMEDVDDFFERASSTEVILWVLCLQLFKEIQDQSEAPHYKTAYETFHCNECDFNVKSTLTSTNSFIVEECCEGMINDC